MYAIDVQTCHGMVCVDLMHIKGLTVIPLLLTVWPHILHVVIA